MADQETAYIHALENLDLYSDKIREIFHKTAGEDGIVGMNKIGELMNELNSIIGIDLSKAKNFFSKSNSAIPGSFNLDATTFEDFIELLKIWIQRKSGKRANHAQTELSQDESEKPGSLQDIPTVESHPGSERLPVREKKKKMSIEGDDMATRKGSRGQKTVSRNMINSPQNYKRNRERMDDLLLKHREEYHEKFYERQDEETEKISSTDFFIFLQDCFDMDDLLLKERITHEQDFFKSPSSFQTLMRVAESYFINVKGEDADEFEINRVRLTFDECFDVIDHWFQTDDKVVLVYEYERASAPANNGQTDVKKVLLDTIAKYKVMIDASNSEVEKQVLQTTVETLYEKLRQLDGDNEEERRRLQQKNSKKREEKKMKALREIFEFYAKQQLNGVKPVTFANLEKQFKTISMGKFSVILKNFKMKIDNFKLRELFKKVAVSDDLDFEEFYGLLQRVSKDVELIKEAKVVKPNYEIMKEYKPDSYKKSTTLKDSGKTEQASKRDNLNSRKNEADKLDEMWEHMGLYDGNYRNNMQQVQLAFNSQEKESFRIDPESRKNNARKQVWEDKITEELKEDIAKRNRLREVIKDVKKVEKTALVNYKVPVKQEPYFIQPKPDSYAQQAKREKIVPLVDRKMTLKDVGNSKYSDMKERGFDAKFNPHDLIEENDEEDNYYLAAYNITQAKPQAPPQNQKEDVQREDLEQYKANDLISKAKVTKRQSMAVDGRYSRMYESKGSRVGTTSPQPTSGNNKSRSKPLTSDENVEYSKIYQSNSGLGSTGVNRSLVHISQSVKNLAPNPHNINVKNYGHVYESQFELNSKPQYMGQRPADKMTQGEQLKKVGSGVLDRVSKIQQDSKKREYEIMANLINIQNSKLEQGLRVARK